MKVLFVLENLADRCGANVNIAIVLAKQLSKNFEVHALVRHDDVKLISCEKKEIFGKVHTFYADQPGKLAKFTSNDWNKASRLTKVMRFCKSPEILVSMIDAKYFDFSITKKKCKKAVEEVCSREKYDVVIGVSAPYYLMQAVAESNIDCSKMAIQLDPFTTNYTLPDFLKYRRKRIEEKVISRLDALFAADFVYNEIKNINRKRGVVISLPLPGIIVDKLRIQAQFDTHENDYGYVHFVFVGQFYEQIRNPKYLLDMFTQLPNNYILHIVGGGWEQLVNPYKEQLQDRLILHGWVSKDEADRCISQYDVLVNVNNTITNQMPSKLFEYIGTGKPILNICKTDYCLSLPYIEKYENGISIVELDEMISANTKNTIKFVETHIGSILDMERVLESFNSNTDVYVAGLIRDKIIEEERSKNAE